MKNGKQSIELAGPGPRIVRSIYSFARKGEKNDGTSRTIPDDSFTIEELFNRYRQGAPLPLGLERAANYHEEPNHEDFDMEKLRRMDLTELQAHRELVMQKIDRWKIRQGEIEAEKKAANDAINATKQAALPADQNPAK